MNRKGSGHRPRFTWRQALLAAVSVLLIAAGATQLASLVRQNRAAREAAEELRAVYETALPAEATEAPPSDPPSDPPGTEAPTQVPAESAIEPAVPTDAPAVTPAAELAEIPYPDNPGGIIRERYRALREENRDIVGWLTIGSMVDEAVVQRDNTFYMDHDLRGEPNVNGAIFLDEIVSLKTRPLGLILYGHNMRSGAMFAGLRNYEKVSFYHSYPFFTFNTAWEDGRYVIFSIGTVNVAQESAANFVDFFALTGSGVAERERAIGTLEAVSLHSCTIDVRPEDQLLLLVTCVERGDERRVVAARRIRGDETEDMLRRQVSRSR